MTHLPVLQHQHFALLGQATSQCAPFAAIAQCKKGCAACCHQHTVCSPLEAILVAQALRGHARAAALWQRVAVQAERVRQSLGYAERHARQVACPLLDEDTRTCAAYGARPTACRQVLVVSDPALCAPPAQDVVWILEVMQLMSQVRLHLQGEMERRGLRPDPVELTLALDVLRADPGAEQAWLAGGWPFAAATVPDLAVSVVDEREAA